MDQVLKPLLFCLLLFKFAGCSAKDSLWIDPELSNGPDSPLQAMKARSARTHFLLWQLPSQGSAQNMSYVIYTSHKKIIVIDGGWTGADGVYIRTLLTQIGGNVEAWFVTHPHPDHVGALTDILQNLGGIHIKQIYTSLNSLAWLRLHETSYIDSIQRFTSALTSSGVPYTEPSVGDVISIDGVDIEILGVKNPEIWGNGVNNSTMVFRVVDATRSVLFLGDMGREGGDKILAGAYASHLPSDYVQVSHHGQNGVTKEFYQAVAPKVCLWPTPIWLWNNDSGTGYNSGPWRTLEVRQWMSDLGITKHYVSYVGFRTID